MSLVICKATGIKTEVVDSGGMLFTLGHPLSKYAVVIKTFKGLKSTTLQNKALIAGSIITVLKHHNMFKTHGEDEALAVNDALVSQSKTTGQLLAMLHRLLREEERLKILSRGVVNNSNPKELKYYMFSMASSCSMGTEHRGEQDRFLDALQGWLAEILPPTQVELLALSEQHNARRFTAQVIKDELSLSMDIIEMEDGTQVNYDSVIDSIKNLQEDNVYKKARRMNIEQLKDKAKAMTKLALEYNIFTENQMDKLYTYIKHTSYKEVILNKAIALVNTAAYKDTSMEKRAKMFEIAAWLKASHAEFKSFESALTQFEDIIEQANTDQKVESLADRMARLKRSKK